MRTPRWAFISSRKRGLRESKSWSAGPICAYPKVTPIPFREDDLWNGYPRKRTRRMELQESVLVQLQSLSSGIWLQRVFLAGILWTRDNSISRPSRHPGQIRKFIEAQEAGEGFVTLWGDGSPTREFLYVEDATDGILRAAELYDGAEPVNLGRGEEISIRDLAAMIAEKTGFRGEIRWDTSKPNGQERRMLDVTRAAQHFGFRAGTSMDEGMAETITWYRQHRAAVRT